MPEFKDRLLGDFSAVNGPKNGMILQ